MNALYSDITHLRLRAQQLRGTHLKNAQDMVKWFGAVQAQEYALTKWGIGLRIPDITETEIEEEINSGKILRTHLLRPTWHFVVAEDIHWLLQLTAPRIKMVNAFMYRKVELDWKLFESCNQILSRSLKGEHHLTRTEINEEFRKNNIHAEGHRLGYIMMQAELDGIICSGTRRGNKFTYALLEERVPKGKIKSPADALSELTLRYFTSRGPATIYDFSTWSGLTITDCKIGIELNKNTFLKLSVGKADYYYMDGIRENNRYNSGMIMLPPYDEYIMGYKDRSAMLKNMPEINPGRSYLYSNMIIDEGQIVGTWKRTPSKGRMIINYEFFGTIDNQKSVDLEKLLRRLSEFYKMNITFEKNLK